MFVRGMIILTMPVLVFLNVSVSDNDVTILNNVKYVHGFKLRTGVFRVFDNSSYTGCVRECLLRRHCLAITYHLTDIYCHLGSQANDLEMVSDNKMISSHPIEWDPPKSIAGNCSENPCATGQRCTQLTSGRVVCVYTECSDPEEVTSYFTPSSRSVGVTIAYEYVSNASSSGTSIIFGNPNITCKADGTWTNSNFTVLLCPTDFQIVAGAYCILLVTNQSLTAAAGDTYCQTKGSRLIWMTSVEKFDTIVSVIEFGRYFLAGSDADVEGTWRLPDGEEMTWAHSRAKIIDTESEDCITYDDSYGKLRDYSCTGTHFIICEIV
ncbi:uncharacterized protein LOC117333821 [Pecten maximus]|uniref:uncharacterized protein LOC117333821 n=1 Tax=Pecten maximus TaxID=6579 RepID=UPI001458F735|nr:uncharacterized protein LOC117333821 [Pecten maximus]